MPPRPCPYLVKSAAKSRSGQKRVQTLWLSIRIPANCPRLNHPFAVGLEGEEKHNLNRWGFKCPYGVPQMDGFCKV